MRNLQTSGFRFGQGIRSFRTKDFLIMFLHGGSINTGPKNKCQYTGILILWTPKKGPLTFGNPHIKPGTCGALVDPAFRQGLQGEEVASKGAPGF